MKVAVISDIHSNLEAFDAVYEKIEELGVDRIYCLGDIVGYGPNPREIVDSIRNTVRSCVLGNHDEAVIKEPKYFNRIPYEAIKWTKVQLSIQCEGQLDYLRSLRDIIFEDSMVFTHGLLDNNMCYVDNTDDLTLIFKTMKVDDVICFGGHSHYPCVWGLENQNMNPLELKPGQSMEIKSSVEKIWVNVGSVGQPRDGDCRASFMTWETESRELSYHRIPYDHEKTMSKIRKVPELDNFLAERLAKGQ